VLDSFRKIQALDRTLTKLAPQQQNQVRPDLSQLSLLDFVPTLTPSFDRPDHLAPVADAFELSADEAIRACVSVPTQHGKTELVKHGLVWLLTRDPAKRHAYITYSAERVQRITRPLWALAEAAGLKPAGALARWTTPQGGGGVLVGTGGGLTGEPIDGILVVDDPHKGRQEAESGVMRAHVRDWFNSVAFTRLHPGSSVLVVHSRWHPDDLIGQLHGEGWKYINLPAVNDGSDKRRKLGEELWPAHRPLKWLQEQRKNDEYAWVSLYQGKPRPRGGTLFRGLEQASYYTALPSTGFQQAYGVDLAYTSKTHADWSVSLRMLKHSTLDVPGETSSLHHRYYVADLQRAQVDAPSFMMTLMSQQRRHAGRMRWDCSGSEKGSAQFIQTRVPALQAVPATSDKFQRAQPVAAAWNAGDVLLPEQAPWLDAFISEVCSFTGVQDLHDDQVDALSSAYAALQTSGSAYRDMRKLRRGLPQRRI
jgi:predicted phage terminase large subunit-like protein